MCTTATGTNTYRLRLKNKCMHGVKKGEFELEYSAKISKYKGPSILSMTDRKTSLFNSVHEKCELNEDRTTEDKAKNVSY